MFETNQFFFMFCYVAVPFLRMLWLYFVDVLAFALLFSNVSIEDLWLLEY